MQLPIWDTTAPQADAGRGYLQARTDDISLAFINGFLPRVTSSYLRSRDVTRKSYSDETERIGYRKSAVRCVPKRLFDSSARRSIVRPLSRALPWFRRAVEIDPNYALAWPAPLRCGPANLQAISPQHSSECERSQVLSAISSIPTLTPARSHGERSMHRSKCAAMHGNQSNYCRGERPF